jgi:ribonuclease HII
MPPAGRKLTLAELRQRYVEDGRPLPRGLEAALRADGEPDITSLLQSIEQRRHEKRAEGQRLRTMLKVETLHWKAGLTLVAGIDEAGIGPLAGPVSAAAVILAPGTRLPHVDDSKKLSEDEREELAPIIRARAHAWAVAFVEHDEIDRINIYRAGLLAMQKAVLALSVRPEHLLIDGRILRELDIPQQRIFGGDGKSLSIAAASILAKTARDARMREYELAFPGYGFAKHKGYPTRAHVDALRRLGLTPIHRRSFEPVRLASRTDLRSTEQAEA